MKVFGEFPSGQGIFVGAGLCDTLMFCVIVAKGSLIRLRDFLFRGRIHTHKEILRNGCHGIVFFGLDSDI